MGSAQGNSQPGALIGATVGLVIGGVILLFAMTGSESAFRAFTGSPDYAQISLLLGGCTLISALLGALMGAGSTSSNGSTVQEDPSSGNDAGTRSTGSDASIVLSSSRFDRSANTSQEDTEWEKVVTLAGDLMATLQRVPLDRVSHAVPSSMESMREMMELSDSYREKLTSDQCRNASDNKTRRVALQLLSHRGLKDYLNISDRLLIDADIIYSRRRAMERLAKIGDRWTEYLQTSDLESMKRYRNRVARNILDFEQIHHSVAAKMVESVSDYRPASALRDAGFGSMEVIELDTLLDRFSELQPEVRRLHFKQRQRKRHKLEADEASLIGEYAEIIGDILGHRDIESIFARIEDLGDLRSEIESHIRQENDFYATETSIRSLRAMSKDIDELDLKSLRVSLQVPVSERTIELLSSPETSLARQVVERGSLLKHVQAANIEPIDVRELSELVDHFAVTDAELTEIRTLGTTLDRQMAERMVEESYLQAVRIVNHDQLIQLVASVDRMSDVDAFRAQLRELNDDGPSRRTIWLVERLHRVRSTMLLDASPASSIDSEQEHDPLQAESVVLAGEMADNAELMLEIRRHERDDIADSLLAVRRALRQLERIEARDLLKGDPVMEDVHQTAINIIRSEAVEVVIDDILNRSKSIHSDTRDELDDLIKARDVLISIAECVKVYHTATTEVSDHYP